MMRSSYRAINRKFNTFRKEPVRSTPDKVIGQTRWLLEKWGKFRLRQEGAFDPLMAFLAGQPPSSIPPDFADLWFLYQHALRIRRASGARKYLGVDTPPFCAH
jgi:hypothetical protein